MLSISWTASSAPYHALSTTAARCSLWCMWWSLPAFRFSASGTEFAPVYKVLIMLVGLQSRVSVVLEEVMLLMDARYVIRKKDIYGNYGTNFFMYIEKVFISYENPYYLV